MKDWADKQMNDFFGKTKKISLCLKDILEILEKYNSKKENLYLDNLEIACVPTCGDYYRFSIRFNARMKDIEKMSSIQKRLLTTGLEALNSGGILLYCACSIAPEENELVVHEILNKSNNCKIIEISKNYGVKGLTNVFGLNLLEDLMFSQRLYPHLHDTIGFYFCLIKKED